MLRRRALRGSRGVLGSPDTGTGFSDREFPAGPAVPITTPTCFWLTSDSTVCLERVAPEARRRLGGNMVALHRVPGPPDTLGHEQCSGCWVRQMEVAVLAVTAGALLRTGSSVLVAHRLSGAAERAIARSHAGSFVEISLDGGGGPFATAPVPVTYRLVANGVLVERTILGAGSAPTGGPEVFVDGRRGPPDAVAAGIVDILARAGWLHQGPDEVNAARRGDAT